MKTVIFAGFLIASSVFAETSLHFITFGDAGKPAVIFIHGGPGSNSYSFEETVAEDISRLGYYVVAYDQRGSGRSPSGEASDFTYTKFTDDLKNLIETLQIHQPLLVGHSW